jgi:nitrite reductase (NO-forming)
MAHSIDFHASQVAWNDEMTSINPGEEKVYEWKADYAGVWMYHCGTNPALHHIANGMYGMVIVEPKEACPRSTTSSPSSSPSGTSASRASRPT